MPLPIIFGSSSKFRREVLANAGIEIAGFCSVDIDEYGITVPGDTRPRNEQDAEKLTVAIAEAKADAILKGMDGVRACVRAFVYVCMYVCMCVCVCVCVCVCWLKLKAHLLTFSFFCFQSETPESLLITCDQVCVYDGKVCLLFTL